MPDSLGRPAVKIDRNNPGADLAGETAAALAAGYLVFQNEDAEFAAECLSHARDLFDFAWEYRGKYSDVIHGAQTFYRSWSGYNDELSWAAAWLFRATGEADYRSKADENYSGGVQNMFSWDNKQAGYQVLMAQILGEEPYVSDAKNYANHMANDATKTPKGRTSFIVFGRVFRIVQLYIIINFLSCVILYMNYITSA